MRKGGTQTVILIAFAQKDWLYAIFLFSAVVVFGNGIHYVLFPLLRRQEAKSRVKSLGLRQYLAKPARAVFLSIALLTALPFVPGIPHYLLDRIDQVVEILLVLFLGWLVVGGVYVFETIVEHRFDTAAADNLRARHVRTQMQF